MVGPNETVVESKFDLELNEDSGGNADLELLKILRKVQQSRITRIPLIRTKHTDEKSSKTEDSSIPQKNPWIKNEESLNPQKPSSDNMRSSFEDSQNSQCHPKGNFKISGCYKFIRFLWVVYETFCFVEAR
jgi:hypothetical protein